MEFATKSIVRLRRGSRNNAGFTLMEIVFTAGVIVTGLVMLMGSAVNVAAQSKASEMRSQALQFNMSLLESLRGRSLDGLMQFNNDGSELAVNQEGYINLYGLGNTQVAIEYVLPGTQDTATTFVSLPLSESQMESLDPTAMPNPLEVRVTLAAKPGASGPIYKFQSSALIAY